MMGSFEDLHGSAKCCRLFHRWGPWKVTQRTPGIERPLGIGANQLMWGDHPAGTNVEVVRLERLCDRCGDLQLKMVVGREVQ